MSKVVRLPDILVDFFKRHPSVIAELVEQIEGGELLLQVSVPVAPETDIEAMIDSKIAAKFEDIQESIKKAIAVMDSLKLSKELIEEAVAPANFTQALIQKAVKSAPSKLLQLAR